MQKPLPKSDLYALIAENCGLTQKDVSLVMEGLNNVLRSQLSKDGPGIVTISGLFKIHVVEKPAKPAFSKPHPFKPGENMEVKAKPATRIIKVKTLKTLKDMA